MPMAFVGSFPRLSWWLPTKLLKFKNPRGVVLSQSCLPCLTFIIKKLNTGPRRGAGLRILTSNKLNEYLVRAETSETTEHNDLPLLIAKQYLL